MVAAIELGKKYAQICVKTDAMKEPESVTKIAGEEHYRIPVECSVNDKKELQELFRRLWKLLSPYGSKESLKCLVFCLEENSEKMRKQLLEIVEIYNIAVDKVHFTDKEECFVSYVIHQDADLLTYNALLIENHTDEMSELILHKSTKTMPVVAQVRDVSEKTLEEVFHSHAVSSVFLVGDDFEEAWMKQHLKLLKTGKRVFLGKNLYVKGACYLGMDLQAGTDTWIYLGTEKVDCNIALKTDNENYRTIAEGGKNWYESNVSLDVLLLDEPKLEIVMIPINGKEKKAMMIPLENLPIRPKKTTRLQLMLEFTDAHHAKLTVKDLGFGELFPQSDLSYEGELQWEQ